MVGAGAINFAVLDFVITCQKPSREYGSVVEINPVLLSAILGEKVEAVQGAIDFLLAPDPRSRTKKQDGRRLVRLGEYLYQVVNGAKYRAIRDEEERRTQNREAQATFREKKKSNSSADPQRVTLGDLNGKSVGEIVKRVEAGELVETPLLPPAENLPDAQTLYEASSAVH